MADAPRFPDPPKIKLNAPSGTPQAPGSLPPRIRIKPADKKSETARIDLSAAQAPEAGKAQDFKELTKEELAEFYKKSTIRIDAQAPSMGDTRQVAPEAPRGDEAMRTTMRVDDASTTSGETHKVQSDSPPTEQAKRVTMRVDDAVVAADAKKGRPEGQSPTMRVEAGADRQKSETAKLELPTAQRGKQSTSRVSIDAAASSENEDVFKKRTPPVAVPSMSPPAPLRAPTVSLPRPKTMQMRAVPPRPVPPSVSVTPAATAAVTEAKKSETARLDLPPETGEDRPTTRPKTIRIKRPDGTTARKPLMISRPDEEAAAAGPGQDIVVAAPDQPHALFAVAALLAVLVTLGLIYILMAQTIAPTMPMPGRLV